MNTKNYSTMKILSFIILIILFSTINIIAGGYWDFPEEQWDLVKDSDGIKVFSRDVEGFEINEFKAVTILNCTPMIIAMVLLDIPAQPEWQPNCEEARIVKKYDDLTFIFYRVVDLPWPASDRDVLIQTNNNIDYENEIYICNFSASKESIIPPKEDYIRIMDISGGWYFKKIAPNKCLFIYQMKVNPGGSLPKFLVNLFSGDIPFQTIKGLRKMIIQKKYIEKAKKNNILKLTSQ